MREQYKATPGHVLCACDYSQEELVTLAATLKRRFGKSRMADAVNAGLCLHSFFAGHRDKIFEDIDITDLGNPEVVKIIKQRTKAYKEDEILTTHRQQAKMAKEIGPLTGDCQCKESELLGSFNDLITTTKNYGLFVNVVEKQKKYKIWYMTRV